MLGLRKSSSFQSSGSPTDNLCSTLLNVLWCSKINRDKAAGKYDQFIGTGDDREPEFKMVL